MVRANCTRNVRRNDNVSFEQSTPSEMAVLAVRPKTAKAAATPQRGRRPPNVVLADAEVQDRDGRRHAPEGPSSPPCQSPAPRLMPAS